MERREALSSLGEFYLNKQFIQENLMQKNVISREY